MCFETIFCSLILFRKRRQRWSRLSSLLPASTPCSNLFSAPGSLLLSELLTLLCLPPFPSSSLADSVIPLTLLMYVDHVHICFFFLGWLVLLIITPHVSQFILCQRFERIMRATQGALIVASTLQMILGFSGLWRNVVRLLNCLRHSSFPYYSRNNAM